MYSLKATKFLFATTFSLVLSICSAFGQTKKSSASTVNKSKTIIECYYCHGGGVTTSQIDCANCSSWTEEYRKKYRCLKCQDRRWNLVGNTCYVCKGKGKISVTQEELKQVAKIKEQQKKEEEESIARIKTIPKHSGVMSDAEATAFFNAHVDPELRQEENLAANFTMGKPADLDEKQQKAFDSLFKKIAVPVEEKELNYNNVLQKAADGMAPPETRSSIKDVSIMWKVSVRNASFDIQEKIIINSAYLSEIVMNANVLEKELFKNGKYQKSEQGRIREMNSDEKEELNMKLAFFDEAYLLNQKTYRFGLSDNWYVSGNEAHVLTIVTPFGKKRTNYYDVSSGLKLKSVSTKETDLVTTEDLTVEQYFKDYKSYNGVMIPTKITIEQNGQYPIEISLVDVKFNSGLDANDFK